MKPILTHPDWHHIEKACGFFAREIVRHQKMDAIVGLTRGGLIPATILSHMLDLPMVPVNYSAKDGRGDNRNHNNMLPYVEGKQVLIVDDICDSGKTMDDVNYHYTEHGYDVFTAAIYYKQGAVFKPTFYWEKIPEDAPWIIFPWEG